MKANFEVKGTKVVNGKERKMIRTYTLDNYTGVTRDLYDRLVELGYKDVDVKMMA